MGEIRVNQSQLFEPTTQQDTYSPMRVLGLPVQLENSATTIAHGESASDPSLTDRRPSHQQVIAQALALYDEFGAARPTPALIGAWKKRIFAGDGNRLLELLADLGLKGGLEKGAAYVATVLRSEAENDRRAASRIPHRGPQVGDLSLNQAWRWNGFDWDPVDESGEGAK